jgi:hypothetical protein
MLFDVETMVCQLSLVSHGERPWETTRLGVPVLGRVKRPGAMTAWGGQLQ